MLKIKNVTKRFGDITALENITLDIDEGEFVFITGSSGAGKTTLLRIILKQLTPDEGEIFLDDLEVTKLSEKDIPRLRQHIGVVFQDFKVLPERTLEENVSVALAVCGVDPKEWDDRVDDVLKLVGLDKRKTLFPSQLAGGELQRVSLARALVVNPKILLADEPTGNLDWETADKIMDLFEKINKEGKTVIMATHHKGIIDRMGKRVIKLDDGKVVGDSGRKKEKHQTKEEKEEEAEKETKEVKEEQKKEE